MKRRAIYPGSFDPITQGHVNLVHRAAQLFDSVIVTVATNTRKTAWLTIDERIRLVQEAVADLSNIDVLPCSGLTIEFARQHEASTIIRGLRTAADYEHELQLAGMNRQMMPELESVFLPATPDYIFVSATLVREIVALGGDISSFVPAMVMQRLREWGKLNGVTHY